VAARNPKLDPGLYRLDIRLIMLEYEVLIAFFDVVD